MIDPLSFAMGVTNRHQSCQTCNHWRPCKALPLGVCVEFGEYRKHDAGKDCETYDPLTDGEEVIRRGQAIMEAERGNQRQPG